MPDFYDLLIRGATIVDGTGRPRYKGNVGVIGEKIAAVGDFTGRGIREVNAEGFNLSPGFVDPHSHVDLNILQYPRADNMIMQGITTAIAGNCGHGRAPLHDSKYASRYTEYLGGASVSGVEADWRTFGEFLDKVQAARPSINVACYLGHNAVRIAVMGEDFKRRATQPEVAEMKSHVREAMEHGALGLSAGMDYEGDYAEPDQEIVELLKIVRDYDGVWAPHHRHNDYRWPVADPEDYGYGRAHEPREDAWIGRFHGMVEALESAILANKVRLNYAHPTVAYAVFQPHSARLEQAMVQETYERFVEEPRTQGLEVSCNVLPTAYGSRSPILNSFYSPLLNIPNWIRSTPKDILVDRLKVPAFRQHLKEYVFSGTFKFGMLPPRVDPYWGECFRIAKCKNPIYEGKTVYEIARLRSPNRTMGAVYDQCLDAVFDMLVDDPATSWDFILDKRYSDTFCEVFYRDQFGFPTIDCIVWEAGQSQEDIGNRSDLWCGQAPLFFGGFPLFIDQYVKQKRLLTLEAAIQRLCAQPLQVLAHITDRGVIREGAFADLVLFDLDRIHMTGTYDQPNLPTAGLEMVVVNGQIAYEGQAHTAARSGKVLRRP